MTGVDKLEDGCELSSPLSLPASVILHPLCGAVLDDTPVYGCVCRPGKQVAGAGHEKGKMSVTGTMKSDLGNSQFYAKVSGRLPDGLHDGCDCFRNSHIAFCINSVLQ